MVKQYKSSLEQSRNGEPVSQHHICCRNRPQMIKLTRLLSDFLLPRIRDSFMRQFASMSPEEVEEEMELRALDAQLSHSAGNILRKVRGLKGEEKKEAIVYLIK